jgi:hypothetical protein
MSDRYTFPCIFVKGCFQDLTHDLMVTRQQLYNCIRAPLQTHKNQLLSKQPEVAFE